MYVDLHDHFSRLIDLRLTGRERGIGDILRWRDSIVSSTPGAPEVWAEMIVFAATPVPKTAPIFTAPIRTWVTAITVPAIEPTNLASAPVSTLVLSRGRLNGHITT